eukprot:symbB.v1.2.010255.t1/scaffold670.1/size174347/6
MQAGMTHQPRRDAKDYKKSVLPDSFAVVRGGLFPRDLGHMRSCIARVVDVFVALADQSDAGVTCQRRSWVRASALSFVAAGKLEEQHRWRKQ